jgi:hypothetical protein
LADRGPSSRRFDTLAPVIYPRVQRRSEVKVISDFSVIIKIVFICLVVGFVVGFCSSDASWLPSGSPVAPSSDVSLSDHPSMR